MNPWEVVAAKLDRFFFGHDHDTEIVDGAEQLAMTEETEETWLGNDDDPFVSDSYLRYNEPPPASCAGNLRCMYCGQPNGCDGMCAGSRAEKQRNGIQTSPASASARPQPGKRPTPACDIPLSAGVGHPNLERPWAVADLTNELALRVAGLVCYPWGVMDRWGVVIGRFDTEDQARAVIDAINRSGSQAAEK